MRLGGVLFCAETMAGLDDLVVVLDKYELGAIPAPVGIDQMTDDDAESFGARASELGLVIGESMLSRNMMSADLAVRAENVTAAQERIRKATIMGCRSVFVGVGSVDDSGLSRVSHPYMFSRECRQEFREVVLRVLDGVDDTSAKFLVEPTNRTFFYQPEDIANFIDSVDHPGLGLHLDQANMVSQSNYFSSSALIARTFDLLAEHIGSVHLKDIHWDPDFYSLKLDEVAIGDGVLDYQTYLARLATLDSNLTCFCEHLETEDQYALNFQRLREAATLVGATFRGRQAKTDALAR